MRIVEKKILILLTLLCLFFFSCNEKKNDSSQVIKTLSKNGEMIPMGGQTPIMIAAENGNVDMIASLITNGSAIDQKDKQGFTALWYACLSANLKSAQLLLKNGANIEITSDDGDTLLLMASRNQDVKIVEFLLNNKANPNIKDINGESPLMVVFERIGTGKEFKDTALYNLVKSNKTRIFRIIELLIKHQAKVNYVNKGKTVLDFALKSKNQSIINLLLKHGAKTAKELKQSQL